MKPTRSTTPRARAKRAATFSFPTATALSKLPLHKRSLLLLRFLRSKPRCATYDYLDNANCAMGQFAQGVYRSADVSAGPYTIRLDSNGGFDDRLRLIETSESVSEKPRTFGAAADRLAAALGVK